MAMMYLHFGAYTYPQDTGFEGDRTIGFLGSDLEEVDTSRGGSRARSDYEEDECQYCWLVTEPQSGGLVHSRQVRVSVAAATLGMMDE
jgi:hypothetical protein